MLCLVCTIHAEVFLGGGGWEGAFNFHYFTYYESTRGVHNCTEVLSLFLIAVAQR
jgi:hypothetical protein